LVKIVGRAGDSEPALEPANGVLHPTRDIGFQQIPGGCDPPFRPSTMAVPMSFHSMPLKLLLDLVNDIGDERLEVGGGFRPATARSRSP